MFHTQNSHETLPRYFSDENSAFHSEEKVFSNFHNFFAYDSRFVEFPDFELHSKLIDPLSFDTSMISSNSQAQRKVESHLYQHSQNLLEVTLPILTDNPRLPTGILKP